MRRITAALVFAAVILLCSCGQPAHLQNSEAPMDTKAEAHLSPDDNNEANGSAKESEEESPEQPGGTEIVIATFNIKYGAEGLEKIAQAISDVSPDIIGLEEVDVNCERSGNTDEPAELARLAGYPYYAFAKAIPLGGGEYGTAILSRYPIESFEVIPLESGNSEKRSVGHAVVSVDSLKLDVLVTHLSYENRSVRIEQMKTIGRMLEGFDHYVLTGDFNCFDLEEIVNLGGAYYVNRTDRRYSTFRRFEGFSPDNIVVSGDFTEFASGMSDAECSDHRLLYATFLLNVE